MQRIIVTGATSMIGVALIEECIKHGTEVYAVVREGSKKRSRLPDKTGVEYKAQKENGKYSIELPESIGNNVTITQKFAK